MTDSHAGTISGRTRLYAILGDPIAQVGSPAAFNRLFAGAGHDGVMVPMRVAAADLAAAFAGLRTLGNLGGLIFTIPHKLAMAGLVDELMPNGRLVGAVNAVRPTAGGRWQGDMFDGLGCVAALAAGGHKLAGRRVLQIGAGGVGRAIAFAFAQSGIAALTLADTIGERAAALAEAVAAAFPEVAVAVGEARVAGHDTVVNATPLGMRAEDPPPLPEADLATVSLAVDVILSERPTPFLEAAARHGAAVQTGRAMLDGQVREIARFFGVDAH